jgi:hypothetical protein
MRSWPAYGRTGTPVCRYRVLGSPVLVHDGHPQAGRVAGRGCAAARLGMSAGGFPRENRALLR